jgi:DNA uptake protein ComE-like DNA-binding protein
MTDYRVHIAYITPNGEVILPGVYSDTQIDLHIARSKSIITAVDATVELKKTSLADESMPIVNMEQRFSTEDVLTVFKGESIQEIVKIERVQINYATAEQLEKLKYVGKATATKVIQLRPFTSYDQLNSKVPLKNRKWEDVAVIDFKKDSEITADTNIILS